MGCRKVWLRERPGKGLLNCFQANWVADKFGWGKRFSTTPPTRVFINNPPNQSGTRELSHNIISVSLSLSLSFFPSISFFLSLSLSLSLFSFSLPLSVSLSLSLFIFLFHSRLCTISTYSLSLSLSLSLLGYTLSQAKLSISFANSFSTSAPCSSFFSNIFRVYKLEQTFFQTPFHLKITDLTPFLRTPVSIPQP